jgi:hypothetical protein
MFHGLITLVILGFCKFICFEKTDIAEIDWSCIPHSQGGYYHQGILTKDDQPANQYCPRDAPFVEGGLHYLYHVLSHENKRTVLLSQKSLPEIRS